MFSDKVLDSLSTNGGKSEAGGTMTFQESPIHKIIIKIIYVFIGNT